MTLETESSRDHDSETSIFNFQSFGAFMQSCMEAKLRTVPGFSYEVLARKLGIKSKSQISMIARGERNPSQSVLVKLCEYFGLNRMERSYAELLVALNKAKTDKERKYFQDQLRVLKPSSPDVVIDLNTLELLSNWHHMTILEMTELESFKYDPEWIARKLRNAITAKMAESSLRLLQKLGLAVLDENGRLRKSASGFKTPRFSTSDAVRDFYRKMLEKTLLHLDTRPSGERYFAGTVLAVNSSKLTEAKNLIANFRDQMKELIVSQEGDEVYYLGVQFMPLTHEVDLNQH